MMRPHWRNAVAGRIHSYELNVPQQPRVLIHERLEGKVLPLAEVLERLLLLSIDLI